MKKISDILKELVPEKGKTNSEVARKLGISSQLLGQYISARQKPKPEFYVKWKEVFGEDLLSAKETNVSRETHTEALIISLKERIQEHKERLNEEKRILEKHNDFLQDLVKSNLIDLATGQRLIRAQVRAIHQWDAHMAAKGDPKKEDALLKQMGKRINDNFQESHEGDSLAGDGK